MKNPREIKVVVDRATYEVPTYFINKDGIQDGEGQLINFCKGRIGDPEAQSQQGLFTETLVAVAKRFVEDNNKGEFACRENSMAITKLDEALMWLKERSENRKERGVQATSKP